MLTDHAVPEIPTLCHLTKRMFGSVIAVAFQIAFRAEKHANNFFYFLKIIFDISTSKRSKKYIPHSILAKNFFLKFYKKQVESQSQTGSKTSELRHHRDRALIFLVYLKFSLLNLCSPVSSLLPCKIAFSKVYLARAQLKAGVDDIMIKAEAV